MGFVTAAALLLLSPPPARADDTWNVQSGDWSSAGNWSGGLPTSSTNADIYNGGTATITTTGDACSSLYLGNATGSGSVQMTVGSLTVNGNAVVGYSGTGNFTQSGGTNTITSELDLGNGSGSNGTYSLSGSGRLSTSGEDVGDSGAGNFAQSGGTNAISGMLWLGYWSSGSGTYSLSSGSLYVPWSESVGNGGTGNFTQSGGTNTISDELDLGSGGSGTYSLSGGSLSAGGGEDVGNGVRGTSRNPAAPTPSPALSARLLVQQQRDLQPQRFRPVVRTE